MFRAQRTGLPESRRLTRQLRHRYRDLRWRLAARGAKVVGETEPDPQVPELAVGAVGMGRKYADWCLTMVTSLRERGEYQGPVYIITDLPEYFAQLSNVRIIQVPPTSTSYRLIAKSCKQHLMSYVTEAVLVYLDSDLVITSSFADWYRRMASGLSEYPMLCYHDNKPCEGAFHGGVVVLDTKRGMPIVHRWQKAVRSGRWGSDQACLYSVAGADGPGHLPNQGLTFLRTLLRRGEKPECIVHVTNGAIKEHPSEALLEYLTEELGVTRLPREFG